MVPLCEAGEVFSLLEGGDGAGARAAAAALGALYASVREPWLVRGLLGYHARTGSGRALDLLARAPDAHAAHLLDALQEQLRDRDPAPRHRALAALAPLAARHPAWLHRVPAHPLARDLLRAARSEREPVPLLHALLALAALLPAAPSLAAPHWPELADALLRPAAPDVAPGAGAGVRLHLQLAQFALFHALYATHPCALLEALRAELAGAGAREAWERSLAPLLRSVRLHPALVTGAGARRPRLESPDVAAPPRRLSLHAPDRAPEPEEHRAPRQTPEPALGSGVSAARGAGALRPGVEPWFQLAERCGAESPLPEPPEAAVEATPENTPAKDTRAAFRFPAESGASRALAALVSAPPSAAPAPPPSDAYAARISRVMVERRAASPAQPERRAAESPRPIAAQPPAGVPRPEPERPAPAPPPPPAAAPPRDARARAPPLPPPARAAAPPRRAASLSPARGRRRASVAAQTDDTWPEPYEFIISDFFRSIPDENKKQANEAGLPCERLDAYLQTLYAGAAPGSAAPGAAPSRAELAEQVALLHAQLMYERWRREAHAERNRRLLGRCREARASELRCAALEDRVRALTRERDDLADRLKRASTPAPAAPSPAPPAEAALAAERGGRARAEARARAAEELRAADAAELQRLRGASFSAARHVEALARAALAGERRGEQVRRLRRELLVLSEREARLRAGVAAAERRERAGPGAGPAEAAYKAALARAEADLGAAHTRAEAATLRVHELEAALAAREVSLAELKRATRHAAEEHAARLRAHEDKYDSLMRVLRAADTRALRRLADPEPAPAAPAPPPAS